MLHILFIILKMIGIIMGAILGIAVLLFCIVFFVPMRYQIEAGCDGTWKGLEMRAKASWLCHLVSGHVFYQDEKITWQMRIFWKKLNVEKKKQRELSTSVKPEQSVQMNTPEKLEKSNKSEKTAERHRQKAEKKKYTFPNICDKIKSLTEKKEKLTEFVSDAVHKSAFSRIRQEVVRLGRFLRPQKLKMNVRFGFEDPYHTGRTLAVLSMLYPFYGEYMNITPDFEEQVLEGDLFIKGHVHGIYAVIIVWNLFFDKNIRIAYKNLKTFKI